MTYRSWLVVVAVGGALGCEQPKATLEHSTLPVRIDPATPSVDLRADVNRNGVIDLDTADEDHEDTWDGQHGAIFLANIDDDGMRCKATDAQGRQLTDDQLPKCNDATDEVVNGADDEADLAPLKLFAWADAPMGTTAELIADPADQVRVFRKTASGWEAVDLTKPLPLTDLTQGATYGLEGLDITRSSTWDGFVTLTARVTVPQQAYFVPGTYEDVVKLRVAPVLTFFHTLPVETAYVSNMPNDPRTPTVPDPDSRLFVAGLRTQLMAARPMAEVVAPSVFDQWTQDFFETGYASMPGANGAQHVMKVYFRSANIEQVGFSSRGMREAGRIVFSLFRGKDAAGVQQIDMRSPDESQSLNSFGNFETIPPYSLGAKSWPLGRVIRGSIPGFAPDQSFTSMTESQKYQGPEVTVDTSWLLVGHVDETISFLKASSPRGWILLVNDARLARQMLQDEVTRGNGATAMFAGQKWIDDNTGREIAADTTIARLLNNTAVMTASAEAAAKVDAQLAIVKRETGITDAEIVKVPFLHEDVQGTSLAHQPGTVNLFVLDDHNVVVPDPHGPLINGKDLFKTHLEDALAPYGYTVRWLDDWNLYHRMAGEVHCGTNAFRSIPSTKWWEVTP